MIKLPCCAAFFLVVLRLVIGWHFLVEGWHKIETHHIGKTSLNTPWSGAGFFKEGYGPAANASRRALQLDDAALFERLTPAHGDGHTPLEAEWVAYFERFIAHYGVAGDQRRSATSKLETARGKTQDWLIGKAPTTVTKTMAWGPTDLQLTVPQRIAEYQAKAREIDEVYSVRLPAFNRDVEKTRLRALKSDVAKIVADLSTELDAQTAAMKSDLDSVLTEDQRALGPPPEPRNTPWIQTADKFVMWAHFGLGACLLLGLFSRLSCLLLAAFLLHVTLIAPALPFAPTPPGAVGHYLYINLYVIEMVALLVLACIPTGRWFGLDALWGAFGRRGRAPKPNHAFTR